MTRDSPREIAATIDELTGELGETAAEDYVEQLLARGWDVGFDAPTDDDAVLTLDNDAILVLDGDGFELYVDRSELPDRIDVEQLPVTSV